MNKLIEDLAKPFPAEEIEWRVGSTNKDKTKGIALAYLTARAVMNRLDDVLGPENWQDSYTTIPGKDDTKGYICTISIRFGDTWVAKQDGADESNMESIKGGISDAFKRTAVKWGVGRYLYNLPNEWVALEPYGSSYKLSKTPSLPAWALPDGTKQQAAKPVAVAEPPKIVEKPQPSVQNEKKAEPQGEADFDHQTYINLIRAGINANMDKRGGRSVTEKARKFAHILLQQAVPDQEQRHAFCKDLFQVESWSDVPGEEVGGFLDWLAPIKQDDTGDGKIIYKLPPEVARLLKDAISRYTLDK